MRDLEEEKRIKEYMAAKMKHVKIYNECMNLADGLDVAKFAELVRADEREKYAKREWVGLTDKELSTLSVSAGIISWSKHDYLADKKQFRELPIDEGMDGDKVCLMQFAQLIEAKLKEKNT